MKKTNMNAHRFQSCSVGTLLTLVAATQLSDGIAAQRPSRAFDTGSDCRVLGKPENSEWGIGGAGQLISCNFVTLASAQVASGVVAPGGMYVLSDEHALVVGRDASGNALAEHWAMQDGGFGMLGSLTMTGADFGGVFYDHDAGSLFLLDCVGQRIVKGAWDGVSPIGSVGLSDWVTSALVPDLVWADSLTLAPGAGGEFLLLEWPMMPQSVHVTLADTADGPQANSGASSHPLTGPWSEFSLNGLTVTEGATVVEAWAPEGAAVDIVDVDTGAVVATGIAGAGGKLLATFDDGLVLGHRYAACSPGQTAPADFEVTCVARHGFPEVLADGTQIRSTYFQMGARIGESMCIEVGMANSTPPTGGAVHQGALLVGFRSGGVDPLVPCGDNLLLAAAAYLPAVGFVTDGPGWGLAYSSIDIPDDPNLVGLVFLTQFAMDDGGEYRLSEVYGAQIEGAAGAGDAGGSPELAAAAYMIEAIDDGRLLDATPLLLNILLSRQ